MKRTLARTISLALAVMLANGAGLVPGGVQPVAASWQGSITVYPDGDGSGRVTSDDGGIDCGYANLRNSGDCSQTYIWPDFQSSVVVTLMFQPAPDSKVCLDSVPGCVESGAAYEISYEFKPEYTNELFVLPEFRLKTYTVAAKAFPSGTGEFTGNGTSCQPPVGYLICRSFRHGEQVTLQAVPGQGHVFTAWQEAPCAGQGKTCTFTANANLRLTAAFDVWLVRIESPAQGGTICASALDPTVVAGCAPPSGIFRFYGFHGRRHLFTAEPASGWRFKTWGAGPCSGQDATCVFTLSSDVSIKPAFEQIPAPTRTPSPTPKPTPTTRPTTSPVSTPGRSSTPPPASTQPAPAMSSAPSTAPGSSAVPSAAGATEEPSDSMIPGTAPSSGVAPLPVATPDPGLATPPPLESGGPVVSATSPAPGAPLDGLVLGLLIALVFVALLAAGYFTGRRARRSRGPAGATPPQA